MLVLLSNLIGPSATYLLHVTLGELNKPSHSDYDGKSYYHDPASPPENPQAMKSLLDQFSSLLDGSWKVNQK